MTGTEILQGKLNLYRKVLVGNKEKDPFCADKSYYKNFPLLLSASLSVSGLLNPQSPLGNATASSTDLQYDSLDGSTPSDSSGRGSTLGRTNQDYGACFLLCLPIQERYPPGKQPVSHHSSA